MTEGLGLEFSGERNTSVPVAYSPCPNDTILFHAWSHGLLPDSIPITPTLADVQHLNDWAHESRFPLTKLSFACLGNVLADYCMLPVGAALGHGCGPKVVSKRPITAEDLHKQRIAVPGKDTTAYLLLSILYGVPEHPVFCLYDEVLDLLRDGQADAGVIIHETRFTFAHAGFLELTDLGEAWERQYDLPIPLGGIAAKRSLGDGVLQTLTMNLQASLDYASQHPNAAREYITEHSQDKQQQVIDQHIELYVNDDTRWISDRGIVAVDTLFRKARDAGLLPTTELPWLLSPQEACL